MTLHSVVFRHFSLFRRCLSKSIPLIELPSNIIFKSVARSQRMAYKTMVVTIIGFIYHISLFWPFHSRKLHAHAPCMIENIIDEPLVGVKHLINYFWGDGLSVSHLHLGNWILQHWFVPVVPLSLGWCRFILFFSYIYIYIPLSVIPEWKLSSRSPHCTASSASCGHR